MPKLTIIRGLPGSGKSTMAEGMGDVHLEADMFFCRSGEYVFDPKLLAEAHAWCQMTTLIKLREGCHVVVSNTFSTAWEVELYRQFALTVDCPFEVFKATGTFKSVHGVPDEIIEGMRERWQDYAGEIVLGPDVIVTPPEQIMYGWVGGELGYNEHIGPYHTSFEKVARLIYQETLRNQKMEDINKCDLEEFAIDELILDEAPNSSLVEERWMIESLKDWWAGKWTSGSKKTRIVPH